MNFKNLEEYVLHLQIYLDDCQENLERVMLYHAVNSFFVEINDIRDRVLLTVHNTITVIIIVKNYQYNY